MTVTAAGWKRKHSNRAVAQQRKRQRAQVIMQGDSPERRGSGRGTSGGIQTGESYGRRLNAWIRDPSSICICDVYACTVDVVNLFLGS